MSASIHQAIAELKHASGETSFTVELPDGGSLIYIGADEQDVMAAVVASGAEVAQRHARQRQQRPTPCSD